MRCLHSDDAQRTEKCDREERVDRQEQATGADLTSIKDTMRHETDKYHLAFLCLRVHVMKCEHWEIETRQQLHSLCSHNTGRIREVKVKLWVKLIESNTLRVEWMVQQLRRSAIVNSISRLSFMTFTRWLHYMNLQWTHVISSFLLILFYE